MLHIQPHSGPAPIVQIIRHARKQVAIETSELNERKIINAIAKKAHEGVNIQIVLARNPHGHSRRWVKHEFHRLVSAGAHVRWSPYRFTHRYARIHSSIVVDDQGHGPGLIDSGSLSIHAIFHSRENLWTTHHFRVSRALAQVFDADWTRHHAGNKPRHVLIISPGKTTLIAHLLRQRGTVDLEAANFGYLPQVIHALEHKGRSARIILPASLSHYDRQNLKPVIHAGVRVRYLHHINIQGIMIAGPEKGFIGSQNLSWSTIHSCRNVGIILRGRNHRSLRAAFNRDWRHAR